MIRRLNCDAGITRGSETAGPLFPHGGGHRRTLIVGGGFGEALVLRSRMRGCITRGAYDPLHNAKWPDQLGGFLRLTYCVSKSVRVRASARTDERPRRQFVVGTCFEGTRGTVRVHTDGTMAPANFKAQG